MLNGPCVLRERIIKLGKSLFTQASKTISELRQQKLEVWDVKVGHSWPINVCVLQVDTTDICSIIAGCIPALELYEIKSK